MKKFILGLFVVLLCLSLVFTGCAKKPEAPQTPAPQSQTPADDSWNRVKKDGKIVAGLDDAYPPMGYRNDKGELIGFDIDMGKEISKRIGVEIVWQPAVWDTIIPSITAKKFDIIISGMNITEERLKEVNFAGPYGKAGQALIVKTGNTAITSLKDVKPDKLGTQSGSTGYDYAKANGFADDKMKLYKEFPLAFKDLEIGRIDAVLVDAFNVKAFLDKMPGVFKTAGEVMGDDAVGIAVRKEDKALMEELNKAIAAMVKDGTLKALSEKWCGMDITAGL